MDIYQPLNVAIQTSGRYSTRDAATASMLNVANRTVRLQICHSVESLFV